MKRWLLLYSTQANCKVLPSISHVVALPLPVSVASPVLTSVGAVLSRHLSVRMMAKYISAAASNARALALLMATTMTVIRIGLVYHWPLAAAANSRGFGKPGLEG